MRHHLGFGSSAAACGVFLGLAAGACSSAGTDSSNPAAVGVGGSSGGYGSTSSSSGSYGSTSSNSSSSSGSYGSSSGSGGGWSGGSSSSSGQSPPPAPLPGGDAGAEPDASTGCELLDPQKPLVLYLSADDSNSMASPVLARELLNKGMAPTSLRTYEFLNYYRIAYAAPTAPNLDLVPEIEPTANAGEFLLQIGVRSFDAPKPRRPVTVTFVLDTSGSMAGAGITRERAAVKAIAAALAQGDLVSMVRWDTSNTVLLAGHSVSGPNDPQVLAAADGLSASGGTDLHSGLVEGYSLAKAYYGPSRLNRVVLISDGGANVGVTDEQLIALNSKDADQEGIYLAGVGVGPAEGYNDLLMDVVTDRGRGAYVYLDDASEAPHVFTERFDETMDIAARGVQVELTLPWYFQMFKFYGEQYSSDPNAVQPQHLAPSDAMVFDQLVRACDPAAVVGSDTVKVKATWETPLTYLKKEMTVSLTVEQLLAGPKAHLAKGKAIVAYAEALKVGSPATLKDALDLVVAADPAKTDPELGEIAALIQKHPAF